MTVVDPRFRGTLVALMQAAGISQRDLADRAKVSRSYLSEIVNGHNQPSPAIARALDRALGADGQLADLVVLGITGDDADLLAAAHVVPRHIATETVDAFGRTLAAQRSLDDTLGSQAMLRPVLAQLDTVTHLVTWATGANRPAWMLVAAQWAHFAGWLHISTGRWDAAHTWLGRSAQWAAETTSRDLVATVLSYQAHLAWLQHQFGPVVGLSQAALRDPAVHPTQRAYDAYQAARGLAVLGDVPAARRWLDRADELAVEANGTAEPLPTWHYYRAPWQWNLERGLALLCLAARDERCIGTAVAELRAGVWGIPEESAGADWAGEYLVYLATALTRQGEVDEAAAVLDRAAAIAEATHSTRVGTLVTGRRRRLAQLRGC